MSKTLRWILVPFVSAFGLVVSVALAISLNRLIHALLWSRGRAMPGKGFLLYVLRFDGAVAAALFVLLGYIAAPTHRLRVAASLLAVGCFLAWLTVGETYSSIRSAEPQRLWWPLVGTLLGGGVTLALLFFFSRARKDV
jgi:hypothetical protein